MDTRSPRLPRSAWVFALSLALPSLFSQLGYSQTLTATPVATGLDFPVFAGAAPGDVERLFITERLTGRVLILDLDSQTILPTPFLDLPDIQQGQQGGLQSIAFHPDYANNGRFYINHSDGSQVRVDEYVVSADPNVADVATMRPILSYPHANNHNGGWIGFSPVDGLLYMATGDGGTVDIPLSVRGAEGQDLTTLKGKILRIDVDVDDFPADPDSNYAIPATNPFVGTPAREEIWAYGLRHPYRASFDPATGDLYIGEVGSIHWEEVNFQAATSGGGHNYGWRALEGSLPNPTFTDPIPADAVDPFYEYPHGTNAAIIGGYVYRGQTIPSLDGVYFYADFPNDQVFSFNVDEGLPLNVVDRTAELFPAGGSGIVSWGRDGRGDLYHVDTVAGTVHKVLASSHATTHTPTDVWVGVASDVWSNDANWLDSTAPLPGGANDQVLEFNYVDNAPPPTFTNDLAGTFVLHGLVLNSPATEGFALDGNDLQFAANGVELPFLTAVGVRPVSLANNLLIDDVFTADGSGSEVTFSGAISGTGGLVVDRPGTRTNLSGDATYTGATVVRGGTLLVSGSVVNSASIDIEPGSRLELEYAASVDKLGDLQGVALDFGTLAARNADVTRVEETFGPLTLRADSVNEIYLAGDSMPMVLYVDSLVREPRSVAVVRTSDDSEADPSHVHFTTAPTLVGGGGAVDTTTRSIIPMLIGDQRASGGIVGFLTDDAVEGMTLLDPQTEYAADIISGATTTDNARLVSAIGNIDDATSINALLLDVGGSLAGAGSLEITSGNVLANDVNATVDLASLQLAAAEAMVYTAQDLAVSSNLNAAGDLVKAGDASLALSGATTVTGEVAVLAGTLLVSGGTFDADALLVRGTGAAFSPLAGTVAVNAATISQGGRIDLLTGQTATVAGITSVEAGGVVRIDGGTLETVSLAKAGGDLFFVAGELSLTGSTLSIAPTGPLGANLVLDSPKTLTVAETTIVSDGASLRLEGGSLASGQLVLDGPGATLTASSGTLDVDELVATAGATFTIDAGQIVSINNRVTVDASSTLVLAGGTLNVPEVIDNGGAVDFSSGTLHLSGSDLAVGAGGLLGDILTLDASRILDISGVVTLDAAGAVTIDGGSLSAASIVNNGGAFDLVAGTLHLTGSDLEIDADGLLGADLSLTPGKSLVVDGTVTIRQNGTLTMASGELTAEALVVKGPQATLTLNGPAPTVTDFSLLNGAQQQLTTGQSLVVAATTQVAAGTVLQLAGGSLTTGTLLVDGGFTFDSGSLELTSQNLIISTGELFGSVLVLHGDQELTVTQDVDIDAAGMIRFEEDSLLTAGNILNDGVLEFASPAASLTAQTINNNGIIRGTGRLLADLTNTVQGNLRVQNGETMFVQGGAHTNAGSIDVVDAEIEFLGGLVNEAGSGQINARNPILRFTDGLTNEGTLNLSFGTADLFGNFTNSSSGLVVVSGGSQATFYDDVDNQGEIRTSSESESVFFAAVTGTGAFTGTGTAWFEGTLQPGNSPAELSFAGDVQFGPAAQLQIEIGGRTPGVEFDLVTIQGAAVVDGTLSVEWIALDGTPFEAQPGDRFEVLTAAGGLTGQFTPELPAIAGDLQWEIETTPTSLALRVEYIFQADFDRSSAVDGDDLSTWEANFGVLSGATRSQGDAELDADVDGRDFLIWQRESGRPLLATAGVPEPTSFVLLATLLLLTATTNNRPARPQPKPLGSDPVFGFWHALL